VQLYSSFVRNTEINCQNRRKKREQEQELDGLRSGREALSVKVVEVFEELGENRLGRKVEI